MLGMMSAHRTSGVGDRRRLIAGHQEAMHPLYIGKLPRHPGRRQARN
jgi:hypothetical protein